MAVSVGACGSSASDTSSTGSYAHNKLVKEFASTPFSAAQRTQIINCVLGKFTSLGLKTLADLNSHASEVKTASQQCAQAALGSGSASASSSTGTTTAASTGSTTGTTTTSSGSTTGTTTTPATTTSSTGTTT